MPAGGVARPRTKRRLRPFFLLGSLMTHTVLFPSILLLLAALADSGAYAQDRIYRCGNEYTNIVTRAQEKTCTLITTGNVTVVPADKASGTKLARPAVRQDAPAQREKDMQARTILESELKKAQNQLAEIQQEYKDGEPDKLGTESRNHQKYLDRKAELKARLDRTEADITSLRRELARLPSGVASTQ
jgi:hypothetical protein